MRTCKGSKKSLLLNGRTILRNIALGCVLSAAVYTAGAAGKHVPHAVAQDMYGWYEPYIYGYDPMTDKANAGLVRIDTKRPNAEILVNGSLVGSSNSVKALWLNPGGYLVEVRAPGQEPFRQHIDVANGKTLHLHPDRAARQ
jgi:hypothetical protein